MPLHMVFDNIPLTFQVCAHREMVDGIYVSSVPEEILSMVDTEIKILDLIAQLPRRKKDGRFIENRCIELLRVTESVPNEFHSKSYQAWVVSPAYYYNGECHVMVMRVLRQEKYKKE